MATDGEWTGFGIVVWSDVTLDADRWFMRANVTPLQAAILLCGQNPNGDDAEGKAERTTTDRCTTPSHFRALRTAFQDLTAPAGQATDLETWVRLARRLGLHYHPWVDDYMAAADLPALKARREAALADAFRQPKNNDEQAGNGAAGPLLSMVSAPDSMATAAEPAKVAAMPIKVSQAAEKQAREDARLAHCEAVGLVFDMDPLRPLPYGIAKAAESLDPPITRQSLSTDVKASLRRRFERVRNGKG